MTTHASAPMRLLPRLSMLAAGGAWIAGAVLASHHPVHPHIALLAFSAWSWFALRCDAWPIVLLGALAAAQARLAWSVRSRQGSPGSLPPVPGWTLALVCAFVATTMFAWLRA